MIASWFDWLCFLGARLGFADLDELFAYLERLTELPGQEGTETEL